MAFALIEVVGLYPTIVVLKDWLVDMMNANEVNMHCAPF